MSEYWVSNKKYWCKYCEIYIADDAPSRSQHENGLRHQGSKERYIKNLYKTGEKKKREEEEEKREMARIDQAARAAFANDVATGRAKASSSSSAASASKPSTTAATRPGDKFANYTTAKDLGIAQEEERKATEALALQQSQGVVGQWEVVETSSTPVASTSSTLPQKRAHPEEEDEEGSGYKVRRRKLQTGLGEIYDPGKIVIEPKPKPAEDESPEPHEAPEESLQAPPPTLAWTTKRWRTTGIDERPQGDEEAIFEKPRQENGVNEANNAEMPLTSAQEGQQEEPSRTPAAEEAASPAAPIKTMFKKRKAPSQPVGAKTGIRKQL